MAAGSKATFEYTLSANNLKFKLYVDELIKTDSSGTTLWGVRANPYVELDPDSSSSSLLIDSNEYYEVMLSDSTNSWFYPFYIVVKADLYSKSYKKAYTSASSGGTYQDTFTVYSANIHKNSTVVNFGIYLKDGSSSGITKSLSLSDFSHAFISVGTGVSSIVATYSGTYSDGTSWSESKTNTSFIVTKGQSVSFKLTAKTGYTINGSSSYTLVLSATSVTISATATKNSYKISISAATGTSIKAVVTSSPIGGITGQVYNGGTIYYNDVISVTYTADSGYEITEKTGNSYTVSGNITLYTKSDVTNTVRVRINGSWVIYRIYCGKDDEWIKARAYVREDGKWVTLS